MHRFRLLRKNLDLPISPGLRLPPRPYRRRQYAMICGRQQPHYRRVARADSASRSFPGRTLLRRRERLNYDQYVKPSLREIPACLMLPCITVVNLSIIEYSFPRLKSRMLNMSNSKLKMGYNSRGQSAYFITPNAR